MVKRFFRSPVLYACLVGAALVVLLFDAEHQRAGGRFLRTDWMVHLLWLAAPLVLIHRAKGSWQTRQAGRDPYLTPLLCLFGFMILYQFSGATRHPWAYYINWGPSIPQGIHGLQAGVVRFMLLTCLLIPLMVTGARRMWLLLLLLLVGTQALCFGNLLAATHGAALYRDDHPSFLFRLWEFSATFPHLVTYNPYWNAGVVNFVGTTSGTTAVGIPFYAIWRWIPPHEVYTYIVGLVYIVMIPWLAVASLRMLGAGGTSCLCAGILALGVSRHFFLWVLHFGTIGAVFSSSFVLPVSAGLYRAVCLRKREAWLMAVLVVCAFFLVQWPPGVLIGAPLVLSILLSRRRWSRRMWPFLLTAAAVVLVLELRSILTIVLRGGALMDFVMHGHEREAAAAVPSGMLLKGWNHLWEHIIEGHPMLIFLGLGGLFVLPYRRIRVWYGPPALVLAAVTAWGSQLIPNMQLGRMSIPLFFLAVVPASLAASRLLRTRAVSLTVVRAGLLALLILGSWNVARIYANRHIAPYVVLTPRFQELFDKMRDVPPPGARILFAGKTVHFYGGGHIAYLPRLTGREMMSDDYYAFPPGTIEYNYPPRRFRQSDELMMKFMDTYNVSHVVTYHGYFMRYFRSQPERYREIKDFEDIGVAIFQVRIKPNLFMRGGGHVEATFNRFDVRLDDPNAEAVLKYNWAEGLDAPDPVELFAWDAGDDIRLIGIRPNGCAEFTIRYRSRL